MCSFRLDGRLCDIYRDRDSIIFFLGCLDFLEEWRQRVHRHVTRICCFDAGAFFKPVFKVFLLIVAGLLWWLL